jgi:hypothetical protein
MDLSLSHGILQSLFSIELRNLLGLDFDLLARLEVPALKYTNIDRLQH